MSFVNLYGIEVYRMALRDTVNEGGDNDSGDGSGHSDSNGDASLASTTSPSDSEPTTASRQASLRKDQAISRDSEEQELTDVVRLDPIAPLKKKPLPETTGSSQRVLLVTRPSQRCVLAYN